MNSSIKQDLVYAQGYNDGYREGFNAALAIFNKQLMAAEQQKHVQILIKTSNEDLPFIREV
ncbi:hypothetical protein OXPF_34530 [Oxobacter pfennigii]|uniref:Uncharacterized protein n=1 Tax=Oxobacter pfennigii TaxID=36849 RepID=A0A0P8WXF4_9CLOT|nr:hypothetical protein [Oxobacter pfennigii]KPU43021.1 hypothetical protein OXPF_34530 [Oxobacter pfennigii]